MRKIDLYVRKSINCVNQVRDAMSRGAKLTDEELFDYNFKRVLVGEYKSREIVDEDFRCAYFYATNFEDLLNLKADGYSIKGIKSFISKMNISARMYKITNEFSKLSVSDLNSCVYVNISDSEILEEFAIHNSKEFADSMIALLTYFATNSLIEGEYKDFLENYLIDTYHEVMSCNEPKAYINKGKSKTLKNMLKESKKEKVESSEDQKIIMFRQE